MIREFPDDTEEEQVRRASKELRLPGIEVRQRRTEIVDRLRSRLQRATAKPLEPTPEELIRGDRER